MSVLEVKNFINGEYVKAMVGDTDVPVYDPSTDTVFAHLPNSSKEDIDLAVNAAKVAFKRLETPPETPLKHPETPLKPLKHPLKHPVSADVLDLGCWRIGKLKPRGNGNW